MSIQPTTQPDERMDSLPDEGGDFDLTTALDRFAEREQPNLDEPTYDLQIALDQFREREEQAEQVALHRFRLREDPEYRRQKFGDMVDSAVKVTTDIVRDYARARYVKQLKDKASEIIPPGYVPPGEETTTESLLRLRRQQLSAGVKQIGDTVRKLGLEGIEDLRGTQFETADDAPADQQAELKRKQANRDAAEGALLSEMRPMLREIELIDAVGPGKLDQAIQRAREELRSPSAGESIVANTPFIREWPKFVQTMQIVTGAAERVAAGTGSDEDYAAVARFKAQQEKESDDRIAYGTSTLMRVSKVAGDLVVENIPTMVEFLATGGLYTAGRMAAAKAIGKVTHHEILEALGSRAVGVAMQTAANPGAVANAAIRRLTPEIGLERDEADQLKAFIAQPGRSWLQAVPQGLADALIEVASERAGGAFNQLPLPAKLAKLKYAVTRRVLREIPGARQGIRLGRAAGYNGPFGEIMEERIGEWARSVSGRFTGIPADHENRTWRQFAEQLAAESVAFTVPSVGLTSAAGLADAVAKFPDAATRLADKTLAKIGITRKDIDPFGWAMAKEERARMATLVTALKVADEGRVIEDQDFLDSLGPEIFGEEPQTFIRNAKRLLDTRRAAEAAGQTQAEADKAVAETMETIEDEKTAAAEAESRPDDAIEEPAGESVAPETEDAPESLVRRFQPMGSPDKGELDGQPLFVPDYEDYGEFATVLNGDKYDVYDPNTGVLLLEGVAGDPKRLGAIVSSQFDAKGGKEWLESVFAEALRQQTNVDRESTPPPPPADTAPPPEVDPDPRDESTLEPLPPATPNVADDPITDPEPIPPPPTIETEPDGPISVPPPAPEGEATDDAPRNEDLGSVEVDQPGTRGGTGESGPSETGTGGSDQGSGTDGGGDAGRRPRPRPDSGDGERVPDRDRPTSSNEGSNWTVTGEQDIAGQAKRADANILAITIAKRLKLNRAKAGPDDKRKLAAYTGWGGISSIFTSKEDAWKRRQAMLKELLTAEEFAAAKSSYLNAHYTSFEVASSMWAGIKSLGFDYGNVVEPSVGSGIFFGTMPNDVMSRSKLFAVEKEGLTATIAELLYESAVVRNAPFERVGMADNSVDLFVSNVPFFEGKVVDQIDPELRKQNLNLHNYFFAKAAKKTRPGGLVVFITSRYSLDSTKAGAARMLWQKYGMRMVGAVRLPYTAFLGNAGTQVVTDIIVMQKAGPKSNPKGFPNTLTHPMAVDDATHQVNEYFHSHPEKILGKQAATGTMYGPNQYNVEPLPGQNLGEQIREAFREFAGNIDREALEARASETPLAEQGETAEAESGDREGSLYVSGGRLWVVQDGKRVIADLPHGVTLERIEGLIGIRDAFHRLYLAEINPDSNNATLSSLRADLNNRYDAFVTTFGNLSSQINRRALAGDSQGAIASLEIEDGPQKWRKADIFSQRIGFPYVEPAKADSPEQALVTSLAHRGRIDVEYIEQLLGQPWATTAEALGERVFKNPAGGWETTEEYLSGDVVGKLEVAKAAAKRDGIYARNVEALEKAQPEPIPASQIYLVPGVTFITPAEYQAFARDVLGIEATFFHQAGMGKWTMTSNSPRSIAETTEFGIPPTEGMSDATGRALLKKLMNFDPIVVTERVPDGEGGTKPVKNAELTADAMVRAEALRQRFAQWALADDPNRAIRIAERFNQAMNRYRRREFDGSHLTLPGKNAAITLNPHQLAAVWRATTSGSFVAAHRVGYGKTFTMIASAMEWRRLGLAKKPVMVAPKHLIGQHEQQARLLYPGAKILVPGPNDFTPIKRRQTINKIRTNDWDLVILSREMFERIQISPDYQKELIQEQIDEILQLIEEEMAESGKKSKGVRDLEARLEKLRAKYDKLSADWKKDAGTYFEEIGIDALLVDEAHEYKAMSLATRLGRIAGVPNRSSQRAFDLFVKTRYLSKLTGGRNIIFATGTPLTNTVPEWWVLANYLSPETLRKAGVARFDDWVKAYGEVATKLEMDFSGQSHRVKERLSSFLNGAALSRMWMHFVDPKLDPIPGYGGPPLESGKIEVVSTPRTPEQEAAGEELIERAERLRGGKVDPSDDNWLKLTTDAMKLALDQRLYDPALPKPVGGRIAAVADNVSKIYAETAERKATQLVWLDLSVPKYDKALDSAKPGLEEGEEVDFEQEEDSATDLVPETRVNLYAELTEDLVARGVKREEIAWVHDFDTPAKKAELFKKMNAGEFRVLIANTPRLATGANIQRLLYAAHHVDVPWRPDQVEQRDGRIDRYGDTNKTMRIIRYVTERSFDASRWGALERKITAFRNFLMGRHEGALESLSDEVTLSYSEVKAIAAGNPELLQLAEDEQTANRLELLRRAAIDKRLGATRNLESLRLNQGFLERTLAAAQGEAAKWEAAGDKLGVMVNGKRLEENKDVGEAILAALEGSIVEHRGIRMKVALAQRMTAGGIITAKVLQSEAISSRTAETNSDSAIGTAARAKNFAEQLGTQVVAETEARIAKNAENIKLTEAQAQATFDKEDELKTTKERIARIKANLNASAKKPGGSGTVAGPAGAWGSPIAFGTGKRITASKIIAGIERDFGVPIRIRRMHKKWGGLYFGLRQHMGPQLIGINDQNALDPFVHIHELAHHLDNTTPMFRALSRIEKNELGQLDYEPAKARPYEGFAQWLAHELTGILPPSGLSHRVIAPMASQSIDKFLANDHAVGRKVQALKVQLQQFYQQDLKGHMQSAMSMDGKPEVRLSFPSRIMDFFRKIKFQWTNDVQGTAKASRWGNGVKAWAPGQSPEQFVEAFSHSSSAMAGHAARDGVFSVVDGRKLGPGLDEAFKPLGKINRDTFEEWTLFIYARHALDVWKTGRNPGVPLHVAQAWHDQNVNRRGFLEASRRFTAYHKALVSMLAESGLLSRQAERAILTMFPAYVPLQRVIEDYQRTPGSGDLSTATVKRLKGSGRQVINPVSVTLAMTQHFYAAANHAQIIKHTLNSLRSREGHGKYVEPATSLPPRLVTFDFERLNTIVKSRSTGRVDQGMTIATADALKDMLKDLNDNDLTMIGMFWQHTDWYNGNEPYLPVFTDGKPKWYRVDPDLYASLMQAGPSKIGLNLGVVSDVGRFATRLKRLGATELRPGFAVIRNPWRDMWHSMVSWEGPYGFLMPFRMIAQLIRTISNDVDIVRGGSGDPIIQLYRKYGGYMAGWSGQDMGKLFNTAQEILNDATGRRIHNAITHPIESIRWLFQLPEGTARQAQFESKLKEHGYTRDDIAAGKLPPMTVIADALFYSKAITTNFGRAGAYGRVVNQYYAYANAPIQDVVDLWRLHKRNPARFWRRGILTLTMPTLLYWLSIKDEDWWQELPAWKKYSGWNFENGVWLPFPFTLGAIFVGLPLAAMEHMFNADPKAAEKWASQVKKEYMIDSGADVAPDLIAPLVEIGLNQNFLNRPIASPDQMMRFPENPEMWQRDYNSQLSKWLGFRLGWSPARIDHAIHGYSGGLASDVIKFVEGSPSKLFGLGLGYSTEQGDSIDEFYGERSKATSSRNTHKTQTGQDSLPLKLRAVRLDRIADAIGQIRDARQAATDPAARKLLSAYEIGTARFALGRKPLASYPNALQAGGDAPEVIRVVRADYREKNIRKAVESVPEKATPAERIEVVRAGEAAVMELRSLGYTYAFADRWARNMRIGDKGRENMRRRWLSLFAQTTAKPPN